MTWQSKDKSENGFKKTPFLESFLASLKSKSIYVQNQ